MLDITAEGSNRQSGSVSGAALLAAFIPAFVTAVVYLGVFAAIRNSFRKFYAPRTFLGTIPEKDRTPQSRSDGTTWFHDLRKLSDSFVLQHNSLDAYLYLRFLKFIIGVCFLGMLLTFPILLPIHSGGGGKETQLNRLTIGNVDKTKATFLWPHLAVATVLFLGLIALIARERLILIGTRQAYLLEACRGARLSARTVLFLNASPEACLSENLHKYFGEDAIKSWPVRDAGDLEELASARSGTVFALEKAEMELIQAGVKHYQRHGSSVNGDNLEGQSLLPKKSRPMKRSPPMVGSKFDPVELAREKIGELAERIDTVRVAPSRIVPERSAVFVAFKDQGAAHRAYQRVSVSPPMPMKDRFLNLQPKEVLWKNLAMPVPVRMSKASLGLAFVIVFTIFFSIPVSVIGSLSNVKTLAENYDWLSWLNDLPPWLLDLLTGFVPPYLTSWFVSYVPKLFRHIAKLSGEPTTAQAELKTQAWYFAFQVFQIFFVTTFSSGAAKVVAKIIKNPEDTPDFLADNLPSASNFYLTYFILQGLGSAASTIVNYSDLLEYLFYEHYWDKTPREKFQTYASMKGTPWASWYPKFTNFLVIAIVYSCIAPLVLGFATVGIFFYYLAYRHQMIYTVQTKVDTKGESYKRALQQMPTGIYLAELCLIGLFGLKTATVQATLMVVLLIITAVLNLVLDRTLRPLELYLGDDGWKEQEAQLAAEDGVPQDDAAATHASSHARRLGINKFPGSGPRFFSDLFDGAITAAREQVEGWLDDPSTRDEDTSPLKDEDMEKAYLSPAFTSKTPKLWIPSDKLGLAKAEIEQNKMAGLTTTDEAAEIDDEGKLHWDHRFENVPIFSRPRAI